MTAVIGQLVVFIEDSQGGLKGVGMVVKGLTSACDADLKPKSVEWSGWFCVHLYD